MLHWFPKAARGGPSSNGETSMTNDATHTPDPVRVLANGVVVDAKGNEVTQEQAMPQAFSMTTGEPVEMTDPATHTAEQAVANFRDRAKAQDLDILVSLVESEEAGITIEIRWSGTLGTSQRTYADVWELEEAFSHILDSHYA